MNTATKRGQKGRKIELYAEKHPDVPCYEIAKNLGVSVTHVYSHVGPRKEICRKTIENKVTNYIRKNPSLTIPEIAKNLGISYNTAKKYKNIVKEESKSL